MSGHGSSNGKVIPAAYPPPVDSRKEFIKRSLDAEDELIEVGVAIVGAGYLHLKWLPSHGINGWTGEPKEKYYALIDATRGRHPKLRAFVPSATDNANPKN